MSFNFMAAVTICSDFGVDTSKKVTNQKKKKKKKRPSFVSLSCIVPEHQFLRISDVVEK